MNKNFSLLFQISMMKINKKFLRCWAFNKIKNLSKIRFGIRIRTQIMLINKPRTLIIYKISMDSKFMDSNLDNLDKKVI